jgi:hypothetical protein
MARTSKQRRIELVERFSDQLWRLHNLYHCVDEDGKKVPFRPNAAQHKLIDNLWYLNLILKARQLGFTTFLGIYGLDQALFNDHFSVGINAHTREDVEKIHEKKVQFPYDNLPEGLRHARPADTASAKKLKFANGSSVEVGTSLRSGTYQMVHISEFGKLCAKFPEKAREIVTGTLETVHPGNLVFIESTAEGNDGYFYDYCMEALRRQQAGRKPNKLQYRLHFFAWFEDPRKRLSPEGVVISPDLVKYFAEVEQLTGVRLDPFQKAWYAEKRSKLQDDMTREHPSYPEEAFAASIEGAYLAKQMTALRQAGRIANVPHEPGLPVNSAWDFGLNDMMCIWFHQRVGMENRVIGYMSGADDDVLYYWREMQQRGFIWGQHFLPHDAGHRRMGSSKSADEKPRTIEEILTDAGMKNIVVVPMVDDKYTAIQETRQFLPTCWIDEAACSEGIKCLDNFRREWDDHNGCWKNRPRHDWAMHGYDAMETLARGYRYVPEGKGSRRRSRGSWKTT